MQRVPVLRDEPVEEHPLDEWTLRVVLAPAPLHPLEHSPAVAPRQPQPETVDGDANLLTGRMLAVVDRASEDGRHARVALHRGDRGLVEPTRVELRLQAADGRELHLVLTERRQHLLDVPEEHRARADEQDALAAELGAVGVQEVGRAVQRDGGLPRARATRDDKDPGQAGAHRGVLLGLDGGDDVRHAAGAVPLQRGQQRALPDDPQAGRRDRVRIEDLVVDADHFAAVAGEEVAAPQHPHRLERGRPVERLGDRRRASR